MSVSQRQLHEAHSDLGQLQARYLEARGWKHTSTTPGCYWLWEKTFERDGVVQTVVTGDKHALAIEGVVYG